MQVSKVKETVVPAPYAVPRMTKAEAGYVDPPTNGQGIRCGNCNMYVDNGTPLGLCTSVSGDINEQYGICEMWAERRTAPTFEMIQIGKQKTKLEAGYEDVPPDGTKCGTCNHFVQPNACDMVGYPNEGPILPKACCREWIPIIEATQEALVENAIYNEIQRMKLAGIPDEEIQRVMQSYIQEPNPTAEPWPGPVVGIDLMPQITNTDPTTKEPPVYQPNTAGPTQPFWIPNTNPYPTAPSPFEIKNTLSVTNLPNPVPSANWVHDGAHIGMEPSMEGEHGFNVAKQIPEWSYPIEDSQSLAGNKPPINYPPSFDAPQFHTDRIHINETREGGAGSGCHGPKCGRPEGKGTIQNALSQRGLSPEDVEMNIMKADELRDNGAHIHNDGTVRLYHHTSPENKQLIMNSKQMVGLEDGVFFSTKKDGAASGFGKDVIQIDIPIEQLQIDDEFGDEAHVRIPTSRPGALVDISNYRIQEIEWNEEDHPRDEDGKFAGGGGIGKKDSLLKQLNLDKERIGIVKQDFIRSPQLSDAGDSFRDFGITSDDAIRHMSNVESNEFEESLESGDHERTDEMFMKAINKDPKLLQNFKENAEEVEAFNQSLVDRLAKTEQVHRFISVEELDNYLETGEFQSKKNDFVSFTVEKRSVFFGERAVTISVPAKEIKQNLKPIKYSALPRNTDEKKEKLESEKHQGFALEVEARLPTNTKIPANLEITINEYTPASEVEAIKQKYSKLGKTTFKNIQRDL